MFNRLKKHWKADNKKLLLILLTFTFTGSITAWLSNRIPIWLLLEKFSWVWWLSKIGVFVLGYQVLILIIGFCLGQFSFFWNYEKKILKTFGLIKNSLPNENLSVRNICLFASGAGSNVEKIIEYFKGNPYINIVLIVCNNPNAGVISIATRENIPCLLIQKSILSKTGYVESLAAYKIDLIVLAGFLLKVPDILIEKYKGKIINLHPALLPEYGGAGMYGAAVHKAVLADNRKESGITIHHVDNEYDHGAIIFQKKCEVNETETIESLTGKIRALEHQNFAPIIESILLKAQ
ncbi:MAG: phosphoribosylglycinamide formyltransferase [Bacteroidetes bacterium]|nr:phosphoribosylglycinamide formyltransferase [Bacteroidota bacterium]